MGLELNEVDGLNVFSSDCVLYSNRYETGDSDYTINTFCFIRAELPFFKSIFVK